MRKLLLVLTVFLTVGFGYAQKTETVSNIDPQRPTLTESNTIVDKGVLQFEGGAVMNSVDSSLEDAEMGYNVFVRYSVADVLELRTNLDLKSPNFNLGAKFLIVRENNKLGLGVSGIYTYYGADTDGGPTSSDYRLAITKNFKNGFYVTYNVGNDTAYDDIYHIGLVGKSFGRLAAFGEYKYVNKENEENEVRGGITYRILSNLQVDVNGGYFTETEQYYLGAGVAFNVR